MAGGVHKIIKCAAPTTMLCLPLLLWSCRYNQHTKHCPSCKAALRNTELAIGAVALLASVAAGSLIVSAINAASALPATGVLAAVSSSTGSGLAPPGLYVVAKLAAVAAAIAAIGGAVMAGLYKLRQQFIFVDYVHAEH